MIRRETGIIANSQAREKAQSVKRIQSVPDKIYGTGATDQRQRGAVIKRDRVAWLVAGAAFANGIMEILRVLVVRIPDNFGLSQLLPFGLHYWNRSLTLVFGFALLYLSVNLFRRKQVAWWLTTASCAGVVAVVLVPFGYNRHWYAVVAPAVTLVLLLLFRKRFTVHSEPRSIARGFGIVLISIALTLVYGTAGFWLLDEQDFQVEFGLQDAFVDTLSEYTLVGNSDLVPQTRQAEWFLDSLDIAGLITGSFAAYSLFRPLAYRLRTLPHERREAKRLLEKHGTSSLDYFKLWPDKSYFFSEDRESFITYKMSAGVAIALGDPVGPEQGLEEITRAFMRYCTDNGWRVAFLAVPTDLLPMYRHLGMQAIKIGEEALVDLEHFRSHTAQRKKLRATKRKFEREGYMFARHAPPHPQGLLDEVEEVSEEWLTLPGRRERSFTLGSFDRGYLNENPMFVLRDPQGTLVAFVNEIPSYRAAEEADIDMMRHQLNVPNGTMDYLLIKLMLAFGEEGYTRFNLGVAPLSGVGSRPGDPLKERALRQAYKNLNRFFSFKGLRNYKAKFEPDWEDRFLVYRGGPPSLARIGVALTRVTEG